MEKKKGKKFRWPTTVISGRVSVQMHQAVLDVIALGKYVDITDYLRDLIRKDLEARGITLENKLTQPIEDVVL